MDYKLYAIRVFVTDWDRALAFYRDTMEIPLLFENAEFGWAEFDTSGGRLALERASDAETQGYVGRFVGLSLAVDDIDAVYRTLRDRGVEFTSPPQRQNWGGWLAQFRDPDGNGLTLLGGAE